MRGLKVRSVDTLPDWSAALKNELAVGGVREYIDSQDLLAMLKSGGTFTGPVILAGDAQNNLGAVTLQQLTSAVNTAVSALVAGAPASLDTLNEIAAALNNDANAVTQLITSIAGKASLTGAVFTGPITIPSNTIVPGNAVNLLDVQNLISAIPPDLVLDFNPLQFTNVVIGPNRAVGLADSGVVAGTYSRVVVNAQGMVTQGLAFTTGDLPLVNPVTGTVFNGTAVTIEAALAQLQASIFAIPVVDTTAFVAKAGDVMTGKLSINAVYTLTAAGDVVLKSHLDAAIASVGNGLVDYSLNNGETVVTYTDATKIHDVVLSNQSIVAGAYTKVTLNTKGVATAAGQLLATDLPSVTPQTGGAFNGTAYPIVAALNALDTQFQTLQTTVNAPVTSNGIEETWLGNGNNTVFGFSSLVVAEVVARARRLFVFIDGLRQPPSQFSIGASGLTFTSAPVVGAEIEAVFIA